MVGLIGQQQSHLGGNKQAGSGCLASAGAQALQLTRQNNRQVVTTPHHRNDMTLAGSNRMDPATQFGAACKAPTHQRGVAAEQRSPCKQTRWRASSCGSVYEQTRQQGGAAAPPRPCCCPNQHNKHQAPHTPPAAGPASQTAAALWIYRQLQSEDKPKAPRQ